MERSPFQTLQGEDKTHQGDGWGSGRLRWEESDRTGRVAEEP